MGKVYDKRDQAVEQLRLMQQASEHSNHSSNNLNQDIMEVEDMPAEAPIELKGTDLQKMQRAMGKTLAPM